MYLYLDLIWLLNFAIDYLLLWLTALFLRRHCKKWRLALASIIGSSFILVLFIPPLASYYTFLTKCILSTLMIFIAFGFDSVEQFVKSYLMFCFVSFVTGGGLLAVHYMLKSQHQLMQGMVATHSSGYGDPVSWLFVAVGFPLLYWFSKRQWQGMERIKLKAEMLVDVDIYLDKHMISVTGLVDTGNQLYHPLSKKPVIIVEAQYLESIVPQMVMSFIRNIDQLGEAKLDDVDNKWLSRLSMMPYRGVGQKMGMLCTIQPDQVIIKAENGEYKTSHVLLGGSEGILSSEGLYQAIVHPDVLMESRTGDFDYGEAVKC